MDNKSISHTRWNCTNHIGFIPKYRRKVMYGETKKDLVEIIKKLFCFNASLFLCPGHNIIPGWAMFN